MKRTSSEIKKMEKTEDGANESIAEEGAHEISSKRPKFARSFSLEHKQFIEEHPEWNREQAITLPEGYVETYLDEKNITRKAETVKIISQVMGWDLCDTVVFCPTREALHQTIVALTIGIRFKDKAELTALFHAIYTKRALSEISKWEKKCNHLSQEIELEVRKNFEDVFSKDEVILAVRKSVDAFYEKQGGGDNAAKIDLGTKIIVDSKMRQKITEHVQTVIKRIIQEVKNFKDNHRAGSTDNERSNKDLIYLNFQTLPKKENFERVAWAVVGGPAAGKSYLARNLEWDSRKRLDEICKINPDDYKDLLLLANAVQGPWHAAMTHEESSIIAKKIKICLGAMMGEETSKESPQLSTLSFTSLIGDSTRQVPDLMLDLVSPSDANIKIAGHGGATVNLAVVTCDPLEAMKRAHRRAKQGSEQGRFVPPQVILNGHKKVSLRLPCVIANYTVFLKLYNTQVVEGSHPELVMSTLQKKQLAVYNINDMFGFLRNIDINSEAKNKSEVYLRPASMHRYVELLNAYTKFGIEFLFCAGSITEKYASLNNSSFTIDNLSHFLKQMGTVRAAAELTAAFVKIIAEIPSKCQSILKEAEAKPRKVDISLGSGTGKLFISGFSRETEEEVGYKFSQITESGPYQLFFKTLHALIKNKADNEVDTQSPENSLSSQYEDYFETAKKTFSQPASPKLSAAEKLLDCETLMAQSK